MQQKWQRWQDLDDTEQQQQQRKKKRFRVQKRLVNRGSRRVRRVHKYSFNKHKLIQTHTLWNITSCEVSGSGNGNGSDVGLPCH